MKTLPTTDVRYWVTILAACTMGETAGDFFSHGLHLGYAIASAGLLVIFATVLVLELRAHVRNEARYWTAVVITSTTGTTLADFFTRTLKLGYPGATAALFAILGAIFFLWKKPKMNVPALPHVEIGKGDPDSVLPHVEIKERDKNLPNTDARYWAIILVVSTIGTTLGDSASDALDSTKRATIALGVLLAGVLFVELRAKLKNEARYWTAIVLTSTIGATLGDYLTKEDGLNLGVAVGTAGLGVFFVLVVIVGRLTRGMPSAEAKP